MMAAHWLVEEGIGEHRAILLEGGTIAAARLDWPGGLSPGQIENAVLAARHAGTKRGVVKFADGNEALVDRLPSDATEGATIRVMVTRAAMVESGRTKLPHVRPATAPLRPAPTLAERLRETGDEVRIVRRFPGDEWPELFAEAWEGTVAFAGGSLIITPTPAMTLIDIDGILPARKLAQAAVPAIATAIRRFDLAGSIGIDLPGLERKEDRRTIDLMLAEALTDWPHEATAMNGFGFVQLVARLETPSILQRLRADRAGAAARMLLRQAEGIESPGRLALTCHPAIRAAIRPEWETELARRTGRPIVWIEDRNLAFIGGFAQAVSS